ncbi:RxLR-like protein [Plasmopara halstedii]|uniref:RxLR-like protein n=1 Tax=Plasmopara halstedii TaxID=4781 RepID=A0A0P1ACH2_PLAHL|nr:RxLR-like protein [Plasmopara halstedii]CEG38594.1 RxLR-like protein [Plasmopara halstedii]|eukprot:XP_024574963.1 RxLR-like protein [Plasmopara halstedii]
MIVCFLVAAGTLLAVGEVESRATVSQVEINVVSKGLKFTIPEDLENANKAFIEKVQQLIQGQVTHKRYQTELGITDANFYHHDMKDQVEQLQLYLKILFNVERSQDIHLDARTFAKHLRQSKE